MGRAFAPRIDSLNLVRLAGGGGRRVAGLAAASAGGPATNPRALDTGQLRETSGRAARAQSGRGCESCGADESRDRRAAIDILSNWEAINRGGGSTASWADWPLHLRPFG